MPTAVELFPATNPPVLQRSASNRRSTLDSVFRGLRYHYLRMCRRLGGLKRCRSYYPL